MKKFFLNTLLLGLLPIQQPQPARPVIITQSQLESWAQTWQAKLGLEEWKVSISQTHTPQLGPDTLGNMNASLANHSATISVLNPDDYAHIGHGYELLSADDVYTDVQRTIVHEMLHLELSILDHRPGTGRAYCMPFNRCYFWATTEN